MRLLLDITMLHAQRAGRLPGEHRDPFDRMLIAQSFKGAPERQRMILPTVRGIVGLLEVVLILFFAGVQVFLLPPEGWVTGDQGSKFLQTRAFAAHGPLDPGIDVLSRDLDPDYRYQEPKMKNRRGRLVSEFLWLLPLITAPFYLVFGLRGLYVVPALSVIAIAIAAAVLARHLAAARGTWLAWVVIFATPVFVYGLEFWEHAPAVACVMAAAVLAYPAGSDRRRDSIRLIGAGAAVAVGALFREEVVVALPAFVVARAVVVSNNSFRALLSGGLSAAVGAFAVFVAAVPVNLLIYGTPLPMHVTQDAWEVAKAVPYWQVRRDMVFALLLPAEHIVVFITAAAVGLSAGLVQRRRQDHDARARDDHWAQVLLWVVHFSVIVMVMIAVGLPVWKMAFFGARGDAYLVTSAAHSVGLRPCVAVLAVVSRQCKSCDRTISRRIRTAAEHRDIHHRAHRRRLAVESAILSRGCAATRDCRGGGAASPERLNSDELGRVDMAAVRRDAVPRIDADAGHRCRLGDVREGIHCWFDRLDRNGDGARRRAGLERFLVPRGNGDPGADAADALLLDARADAGDGGARGCPRIPNFPYRHVAPADRLRSSARPRSAWRAVPLHPRSADRGGRVADQPVFVRTIDPVSTRGKPPRPRGDSVRV